LLFYHLAVTIYLASSRAACGLCPSFGVWARLVQVNANRHTPRLDCLNVRAVYMLHLKPNRFTRTSGLANYNMYLKLKMA
jgi:hypothetical protein